MGNPWFQFKQFRISQENSALRVGTDGVLLGAWCRVAGVKRILDVGTGTGVIALMLAQRTDGQCKRSDISGSEGEMPDHPDALRPGLDSACDSINEPHTDLDSTRIDAVEISAEACSDAFINFQNSPWKVRITLHHADFMEFQASALVVTQNYHLIVSNPPFFKNSLHSPDRSAAVARHNIKLTFENLISGAYQLLSPKGRLAVIIPSESFDDFRETARLSGFYLARKTLVIPKTGKPPKRVLLEFSVAPCYPEIGELIILLGDRHYSDDFISLTRDFYLNFG